MLLGAWIGGLAVVVAIAVAGREPTTIPGRAEVTVPPAATYPAVPDGVTSTPGITATRPRIAEFVVRGRVARDAHGLRIRLEAADGTPVAIAPLDPTGHGRADWLPFESRFTVARPVSPAADGLFIVAVDMAGRPVDPVRHRYFSTLFLIVEPAARTGSVGNDGLVGGIVFGVPMAERGGG